MGFDIKIIYFFLEYANIFNYLLISPTELMRNPNPPHKEGDKDVHEIDNLDGLYFNNTEQVRNHEIYTKGVGDPRWRESR